MRRWTPLLALGVLVACSGELGTPSEPLRLLASRLDDAVLDEPYNASILATGGLRPYTFSIDDGALPPGMSLSGGNLVGTPSQLGSFTFTVSVSDANLSSTFRELVLSVVELPPPNLTLTPPLTEVQTTVTIRGRLSDARAFEALRTAIRYDPDRFELVGGAVVPSRADVAVFSEVEPGSIRVDIAALEGPITGATELFRFDLAPLDPSTLFLEFDSEYRFGGGRHHFTSDSEGTPPQSEESEELPDDRPDDELESNERGDA